MSLNRFHNVLMTSWFVAVVASFSYRVAFSGLPASAAEYAVWLFLGCIPAALLLLVFRGAPPPTIAQVLYDAEHLPRGTQTGDTPAGGRDAARS